MDHDVIRPSQCSLWNGVISSTYCSITVIQNVFLFGQAFNRLFVSSTITKESEYVRSTHNIWSTSIHCASCTVECKHRSVWMKQTRAVSRGLAVYRKLFKIRRTILLNHCHIIAPSTICVETNSSTLCLAWKITGGDLEHQSLRILEHITPLWNSLTETTEPNIKCQITSSTPTYCHCSTVNHTLYSLCTLQIMAN